MAQIATKFTSDPAQLLAAYNQIYQQNVKLQQMLGQNAQQSKRQHDAMLGWLKDQARELKGMAAGYLTVGTAIHTVVDGIRDAKRAMEDLVAKTRQGQQEFTRLAVASGHAAEAGKLEEVLAGISGLTPEQKRAAYDAVGRTGTSMSMYAKRDVVAALAPLGATEMGAEVAGFAGELSDIVPSLGGKKVANLAAYLKATMGSEADMLTATKQQGTMRRLIDSGAMDPFAALGFEQAAIQDAKNPALVAALGAAVDKQYTAPQTRGRTRLTDDERAQIALAQADPAERLRLIMHDATVGRHAMGDQYDALQRLMPLADSRTEQMRREYGTGVAVARKGLETSPMARQALADQELASRVENLGEAKDTQLAAGKMRAERAYQALEAAQIEAGTGMFGRWMDRQQMWLGHKLGAGSDPLMDALRVTGGQVAVEAFTETENTAAGYEKFDTMTGLLTEIRDELKNGNTERRTDSRTGGTPPRVNER